MTWSASQYSKFEQERTRPVRDLVAAIPTSPVRNAIDLGCGPGNSTEVLAQRYPHAEIAGIDDSDDMLRAARERLPGVSFERFDITTWNPDRCYDVILANASLQWLPDHATLYPRLASRLAEGGSLAIQTPDNLDEPAHRLARELAANSRWSAKTGQVALPTRHTAEFYFDLLRKVCRTVDVWRTTYFHVLSGGPAAVVEWFKGSSLRPFLAPLDEHERAGFLATYTASVANAYPARDDGTVLLPFPRLFVVATR